MLTACHELPTAGDPATFTALSAGGYHTCALAGDGSTWCWGANEAGQLGNGSTTGSLSAVLIPTAARFRSIRAGRYHTCALTAGDDVYCWGYNFFGQLGQGSTEGGLLPGPVAGGLSFASLSAGSYHTCALTGSDVLWCWGDNGGGRLANVAPPNPCASNAPTCTTAPAAVIGGHLFGSVSAGGGHTCALRRSGNLFCWGANLAGQLGDGTVQDATQPAPVSGGLAFVAASAGEAHTCAITVDGAAYCWGSDYYGQLGDSARSASLTPIPVLTSVRFQSISSGTFHSCGITTSGAAYCWGHNSSGQLGGPSTDTCVINVQPLIAVACGLKPVLVAGGLTFRSISAGAFHTCGVTDHGDAYCWGLGLDGELGNGERGISAEPVRVVRTPPT
jgi:alpha-tubulin suppressor-like RCC1 family protein